MNFPLFLNIDFFFDWISSHEFQIISRSNIPHYFFKNFELFNKQLRNYSFDRNLESVNFKIVRKF